jgi:hypothetical protein
MFGAKGNFGLRSRGRSYQLTALHESRNRLRYNPLDDLRGRREVVNQIYALASPNDARGGIISAVAK